MIFLSKRILVSMTGHNAFQLISKLKEIKKYKIKKFALFLSRLKEPQRKKVYKALLSSNIKKIPIIHIRDDMSKKELLFLLKRFRPKYLTIHERSFTCLKKWQSLHKKLFLEMNTDNVVPENVRVRKIGGFCIDLAHFKAAEKDMTKDFQFIIKRRKIKKYFKCNHIGGYSQKRNKDLHFVKNLKQFSYLKTLPKFLFGKCIAIELDNPISEQLKFKKHIIKLLKN